MFLDDLKRCGEAPEWMTEEGYTTISKGYLLKDETPKQMYLRVAKAANKYTKNKDCEDKFFEIMWKNWWCPASPVLSNMGAGRGLPISCFSIHPDDSLHSIMDKGSELGLMSQGGGGVGIYMGEPRSAGSLISGGGVAEGVVPWCKIYDSITTGVSQGSTRRGASVVYLPIESKDINDFMNIRRPTGDVNRRCLNMNHGVTITDKWMEEMLSGDSVKRELFLEVLNTRVETGEPYLMFIDSVNKANPQTYKDLELKVVTSNLCSEILLYTDPLHSFVCCLGSLNLMKYDEWVGTDTIHYAQLMLDCVLEYFIDMAKDKPGYENAIRFAIKGRPIGIGVLGWHSLLQSRMIPFDSFDAMMLNGKVFKEIRKQADESSRKLAIEYGEPEWCKGYGYRNTHRLAIAPTTSNSLIAGGHSAGIEPWASNVFVQGLAKGTFIRKNKELQKVLSNYDKDDFDTWRSIEKEQGSVQHLDFLSELERDVFLTAREINQMTIIKQAAQRQPYIDQGQSLNVFFTYDSDPQYIYDVHKEAWQSGIKTLYYLRFEGVIKSKINYKECKSCEG
jgi:ribonucleoside-diphosphate reductase alpha chain